jgi:hypothetical protein
MHRIGRADQGAGLRFRYPADPHDSLADGSLGRGATVDELAPH